jgi:UDP-N-acetylglucosamine 1-carboxyvinyltransferase
VAAGTGGKLEVEDGVADDWKWHAETAEMGCDVTAGSIHYYRFRGKLRATDFVTYPFPGFPTDLQPCFVALATRLRGISLARTVFDDRFSHCMELIRLGARITITGDVAAIEAYRPGRYDGHGI